MPWMSWKHEEPLEEEAADSAASVPVHPLVNNACEAGEATTTHMDTAAPQPSPPPDRVTPRRSKRVQPPALSIAKGPDKAPSIEPSKCAGRSKPEQRIPSSATRKESVSSSTKAYQRLAMLIDG